MTNLNAPTLRELAALNEQELDAAIERHFGPRRHASKTMRELRPLIDTPKAGEPMEFEPIWYQRRASLAACKANACRSGRDPCQTPDACRIPADDDGSNPDGGMEALAYVMIAAVFGAAVLVMTWPAWWPL